MEFRGKKVAVVGLGVSNLAATRFLLRKGARVSVFDRLKKEDLGDRYRLLEGQVSFRLGPDYLERLGEERWDYLLVTPGMPKDLPVIREAVDRGAVVTGEMPLFLQLCRGRTVGVTGSSGKTTTVSLLEAILRAAGRDFRLGGNLGRPLIEEVEEIGEEEVVVLELSSFQLELSTSSPRIGVLLNVRPNHLDVHGDFDRYCQAKKRIFLFQGEEDWAVLNGKEDPVRGFGAEVPGRLCFFHREAAVECGATGEGGDLRLVGLSPFGFPEGKLGRKEDIPLRGAHNVDNVLAASLSAALLGVGPEESWPAVCAFRPVEHRLEWVAEKGGVSFYDDSISTAPDRTVAALESFEEPLVLIAGGYDKKLPYREMARKIVERVRVLVLLGETSARIAEEVEKVAEEVSGTLEQVVRVGNMEQAVAEAARLARPGEVVLLSPGCASYDLFRDYRERGEVFRRLVLALPG